MAGQCTYRDVYAPALSRIDVVVFVQARIEPGVPRSILLECRRHYVFQACIAHPHTQVRPSALFGLSPFFKHICTDPPSWVLGPTGSTARTFYHRVRKVFQVGPPKDLGSIHQVKPSSYQSVVATLLQFTGRAGQRSLSQLHGFPTSKELAAFLTAELS